MNVITVVGARPQFIKAAVVSRAFVAIGIDERIVHTGQHFDANMSDVFFEELGIPSPTQHLGIGGGTHGQNTGRMIEAIESVLAGDRPHVVVVYGDTDSTLAGALAAVKMHIPVAHVEAGLRSFNRRMPEEINRVLTDHAAEILFAPTEAAVEHLRAEGIAGPSVKLVGDVMYDACLLYGAKADGVSDVLARLGLQRGAYALATIHRAENTDDRNRLASILDGFGLRVPDNMRLTDPVGYLDMVMLEKHARLIATDSGGVQKEAFFHRIPCITLRDETEWVELVEAGWNRLVPPGDSGAIAAAMSEASGRLGREIFPYGSGKAAEEIAKHLREQFP